MIFYVKFTHSIRSLTRKSAGALAIRCICLVGRSRYAASKKHPLSI
jgi:hypothetical protein